MSFLLQHNYNITITEGLASTTELLIAEGITNLDFSPSETVTEDYYYANGGAATKDVTGTVLTYAFTGHRQSEDAAQNYIFSLLTELGPARKTNFKVVEPDGAMYEGEATIHDIKTPSGDANAKGEIAFSITFDKIPTFTPAPPPTP
ncbi:Capsid protein [Exiguobacterium sp. 8H]|uniref:phage tail tube protein n=1 Tax=unclassified Exiguobacterium TaxID=2644629 RepID=UPI0012F091E7|nr:MULTISPECIES: capsid protein [unclassified Exiguobacterium]VXB51596.1 Capsid protein [Exiguobacterium sp. 8A]VXB52341.1 Capsid protein [Exiguobacterium sp. 8H]